MSLAHDKDVLEAMVDSTSLATVVELLAEICHEKADHVYVTWQDCELAAQWTRDAKKLLRAMGQVY